MPLNEADRAWVRQEIRATNTLRKTASVILAVAAVLISGGLVVWILGQWSDYISFKTETKMRLDSLKIDVTEIKNGIQTLQKLQPASLLNLAAAEAKSGNKGAANAQIEQASEILNSLKQNRVPVSL